MQVIRQAIFESPNGTIDSASICHPSNGCGWNLRRVADIEQLTTDAGAYGMPHPCVRRDYYLTEHLHPLGSYVGAGFLLATLDLTGDSSDFVRWLDMDAAVQRTSWTQGNTSFFRSAALHT